VETLRCPSCLNRLSDAGVKQCPACGARVRTRRRGKVVTDDTVLNRPRTLVERELQARIEARTAPRFLQRRRAAKAARRIASLPPSLFEAGVVVEPGTSAWRPVPAHDVIDVPVSAIHETPRGAGLPAAPGPGDPAASGSVWRRWKPARNGDAPGATDAAPGDVDEVVDVQVVDAVEHIEAEPIEAEPARAEPIEAEPIEAEPTEADPVRAEAESEGAGEAAPAAHQPYDWEADEPDDRRRLRTPLIPDRWRTWKPIPRDAGTATPAGAASARPPAEPAPRRRGRIEPRDVSPAAHAPRGAENWQPSESLWARRVFSAQTPGSDVASWPRRRPPRHDVTAE
jgi:hypothetical protein